jgi:hypothetical protein
MDNIKSAIGVGAGLVIGTTIMKKAIKTLPIKKRKKKVKGGRR